MLIRKILSRRTSRSIALIVISLTELLLLNTIVSAGIIFLLQVSRVVLRGVPFGLPSAFLALMTLLGCELVIFRTLEIEQVPTVITFSLLMVAFIVRGRQEIKPPIGADAGAADRRIGIHTARNFGGVIFFSVIAFSWGRYGWQTPWSMSGDGRNHVHVVREVVSASGLGVADGYPGLSNSLSALLTGWRYDLTSAKLGQLAWEARGYGLVLIALVVAAGAMSATLTSTVINGRYEKTTLVAVALSSSLILTPLFLGNLLYWGFLPIVLAFTILVALAIAISHRGTSTLVKLLTIPCAMFLLAITFPPAIPMAVSVVPIIWVYERRGGITARTGRLIELVVVSIGPLFVMQFHRLLPFQDYLKSYLNFPGGMTPIHRELVFALVGLLVLLSLIAPSQARTLPQIGLAVGLGGCATVRFLDGFLEHPYYADKLIWLTSLFCSTVILATFASLIADKRVINIGANAAAVALIALVSSPIIQDSKFTNPLRQISTGWTRPSAMEARKIFSLNEIEPRSMAWRLSEDYVSNQLFNMWLLLGVSDETDVITWPFRADVSSVSQICEFARSHAPMTVWTPTQGLADAVTELCHDGQVVGRAVPSSEKTR